MCRWLYGMRQAAAAWEEEYAGKLVEFGFRRSRAAPTTFWDPRTDVRVVVWGDDLTMLGRRDDVNDVIRALSVHYEVVVRGVLGDEAADDKEVRILNRRVYLVDEGVRY